jgi:isopenicillin N synthase-like dioxygenase
MDDVMDVSKRLFELDLKSKIGLNAVAGSISDDEKETKKKGYRGYFGIGEEDLDNKDGTRDLAYEEQTKTTSYSSSLKKTTMKGGDFKEGFDVGLDDTHQAFFGKNVWPDEEKHESIIGFRQTLLRYQNELLKLADKLMVAFAMSLNSVVCGDGAAATGRVVPMDYFLIRTRNPMCTLRLLHYPPSLSMSNSGCGAHTDYGLFTILQQDCIGGLQVRNKAKQWIDAKPLRGSFVINVGDMLSLWTSGAYASTVHRVISPSSSSGRHRYSVPFFFNPDHDALVETIVNVTSGKCNKERDIRCSKRVSRASEILFARYKGTFQSDDDD